jgi:hypothetical protein
VRPDFTTLKTPSKVDFQFIADIALSLRESRGWFNAGQQGRIVSRRWQIANEHDVILSAPCVFWVIFRGDNWFCMMSGVDLRQKEAFINRQDGEWV